MADRVAVIEEAKRRRCLQQEAAKAKRAKTRAEDRAAREAAKAQAKNDKQVARTAATLAKHSVRAVVAVGGHMKVPLRPAPGRGGRRVSSRQARLWKATDGPDAQSLATTAGISDGRTYVYRTSAP